VKDLGNNDGYKLWWLEIAHFWEGSNISTLTKLVRKNFVIFGWQIWHTYQVQLWALSNMNSNMYCVLSVHKHIVAFEAKEHAFGPISPTL